MREFYSHTHLGTPRLEMGHLAKKLTKGWGILIAKIPLTCMLNAQQISTYYTHTINKFPLSHAHIYRVTPRVWWV